MKKVPGVRQINSYSENKRRALKYGLSRKKANAEARKMARKRVTTKK